MKILVIGKNGQLGSEIYNCKQNDPNYLFVEKNDLDVTKYEDIEKFVLRNQIELIVNCSAYTQVDKAEDYKIEAFEINETGVVNLVNICEKYSIGLLHYSTDYVFDGKKNAPYNEEDQTNPLNVYGESKRAGEVAIMNSDICSIIIRTSWLYSIYGQNFVWKISNLIEEKDRLDVINDQIGCPTNAKDLAKASISIIEQRLKWRGREIYHFSNEGECTWFEFAERISHEMGIACEINPVSSDKFNSGCDRPKYSVLDKSKIKEKFSIEIPHWEIALGHYFKSS